MVHILLGLIQEVLSIAHLVSAAAAAELVGSADAEIDSGFLQDFGSAFGQLPHVLIKAGLATDMIDDIHFFFGEILEVQALGPFAAFGGCAGDHGIGFASCFQRPLSRAGTV